jgi:hypothetical protein
MSRTSPASHHVPDRLLSIPELADYLGVPVATIYRWRYTRDGPVGYCIGRHVLPPQRRRTVARHTTRPASERLNRRSHAFPGSFGHLPEFLQVSQMTDELRPAKAVDPAH